LTAAVPLLWDRRMFERKSLEDAVAIQNRGYVLIRWVGDAVGRGFIAFPQAHHYATDAEAAAAWIAFHYDNIPPKARPPARAGEALTRFASYFASYLTTSFELVREPGRRLQSACGCHCFCCTYFAAAPHLRPRKLAPADKKLAARMKYKWLAQLALDHGLSVSESSLEAISEGQATSEAAALVAYGVDLLSRCSGVRSSAATLALWRQFAWEKAGSPKKDFVLTADAILAAEETLVRALRIAPVLDGN
jgi:hypothetical protein